MSSLLADEIGLAGGAPALGDGWRRDRAPAIEGAGGTVRVGDRGLAVFRLAPGFGLDVLAGVVGAGFDRFAAERGFEVRQLAVVGLGVGAAAEAKARSRAPRGVVLGPHHDDAGA